MALFCICQITSEDENLLKCLFPTLGFFSVKCLFRYFAHLSFGLSSYWFVILYIWMLVLFQLHISDVSLIDIALSFRCIFRAFVWTELWHFNVAKFISLFPFHFLKSPPFSSVLNVFSYIFFGLSKILLLLLWSLIYLKFIFV